MQKLSTDTLEARLARAYDHFNAALFSGKLPECVIVCSGFSRPQRFAGHYTTGIFYHRADSKNDKSTPALPQILINADTFDRKDDIAILSTLVHEMVHHWQHSSGHPSRGGYHNKEWAQKMQEVGLEPSTEGIYDANNPALPTILDAEQIQNAQEGKRTGQAVSHYISPHGAFKRWAERLVAGGFSLHLGGWEDRAAAAAAAAARKKNSKTKFTCPTCKANAWAKPDSKLVCGACMEKMLPNITAE